MSIWNILIIQKNINKYNHISLYSNQIWITSNTNKFTNKKGKENASSQSPSTRGYNADVNLRKNSNDL